MDLPLGRLVCITGVSGSGKSTLVDQIIYRNLRRLLGKGESEPGACAGLQGAEAISDVVLVDQSPLGASSRVNAATYLGVLDPLRAAYAATAEAKEAQLSGSAFSFNSAAGACPTCNGAGYEKIELQFLPDAYVRCPACDGRRFRPEVLEIRCRGYDIASLLDLPAAEVARLFADNRRVVRALQPLLDIGLGYLALSQPAPTLSGGEAQRLKLAGHLAEAADGQGLLYILDEPTTGLHPSDVAVLLQALHRLVDAGNSVVVVEHNLEVARAADWIIDLGPEGGDEGGRVVGEGTPEEIAGLDSWTGQALRAAPARPSMAAGGGAAREPRTGGSAVDAGVIRVLGARENNLRDVSIEIPRNQLVAVTGVSGSGKSTLAFDVLYAEGQRRFLDCLPTYVRQFVRPLARPEVDRVEGVPPTVALEQKLSHGSSMSTVGTASEVYHYLRLLFAFTGVSHCPGCGVPGEVVSAPEKIAERIAEHFPRGELWLMAPLIRKRKGVHKEVLAAAEKRGVYQVRIDGELVDVARAPKLDRYAVHDIEAVVDVVPPGAGRAQRLREGVVKALALSGKSVLCATKAAGSERFYSTARSCPACGSGLPVPDPRLFTFSQKFGACPVCEGRGEQGSPDEEDEPVRGGRAPRRRPPARPAAGPVCGRRRSPSGCGAARSARWRRSASGRRADSSATSASCRRSWRRRCCPSWRRGCACWRSWASGTSRWIADRTPCRPGRGSASGWWPSWPRTCAGSATCSTSRPSGCTRATARRWPGPCSACATGATRWWWSSTRRR